MSHYSDNQHALMTLQGQELWMQATRISDGLSHDGCIVFSIERKLSGQSTWLSSLTSQAKLILLGELLEAVLTVRPAQFRQKPYAPIVPIVTLSIELFFQLVHVSVH